MLVAYLPPLWAVHILDGFLAWPWLVGGYVVAGVLAWWGARNIREEEIAQVGVMTAAFFVATLMHLPVGPTSVHLLLNGLVGLVLGRRAALAIPVGLFLQAVVLGHGGLYSLGVNSCVQLLPALFAWRLFAVLQRLPWLRQPWFRGALVCLSAVVWLLSAAYSATLLWSNGLSELTTLDPTEANRLTFHPLTLVAVLGLSALVAVVERRMENAPEFPLGLVVGELTVLATLVLNFLCLLGGGEREWHKLVLAVFVAHMPIAVIEGVVMGFLVGFLVRVKPDMLG